MKTKMFTLKMANVEFYYHLSLDQCSCDWQQNRKIVWCHIFSFFPASDLNQHRITAHGFLHAARTQTTAGEKKAGKREEDEEAPSPSCQSKRTSVINFVLSCPSGREDVSFSLLPILTAVRVTSSVTPRPQRQTKSQNECEPRLNVNQLYHSFVVETPIQPDHDFRVMNVLVELHCTVTQHDTALPQDDLDR